MASTNEIGHAINVANFEDLIGFCIGYGATYNPSKASIKIPALKTLLTNGQGVLAAIKTTKTDLDSKEGEQAQRQKPSLPKMVKSQKSQTQILFLNKALMAK